MAKNEALHRLDPLLVVCNGDDEPGQDFAVPKARHYHALSFDFENDRDSVMNQQPELLISAPTMSLPSNAVTTIWDAMTAYLPCSISSFFHRSERRKDSRYIIQWWVWMRSSCGIVIESTMSLWVVPLSFILFYASLQLLESILPTMMQMTSMILLHDWRNHGSTTMPMTTVTLPRFDAMLVLGVAMVMVGGIGCLCSWMETEFLNATTEQPMLPVWNLTILVPPDMTRHWLQHEKRFLHMIVSRIGSGE